MIVAVVGVVSGAIALTSGGYWLSNFTQAYCMTLAVLGCALLYGQLGLVSLCQWALVGVGGWISLRVYHSFHPRFLVTMLAGGAGASVIGMIWGLPALRMRGLYLALVTLMLAGAFQTLVTVTSFPVGGPGFLGQVGASGNDRIMMARPLFAAGDTGYFLFVAAVTLACIFLVEAHRHSKPGRAWALIRKNEQMAAASGVRIVVYKAWAFALSGFLAGIAGALLAGLFGQLDASAFPPTNSIVIFIGTLLGGYEVWLGAFLGGIPDPVHPRAAHRLQRQYQRRLHDLRRGAAVRLARSAWPRRPAHHPGRASLPEAPGTARVMIKIDALTVQFGGIKALDALDAEFAAPICGLIGPNGAGKTTLLNVLSGFLTPSKGTILLDDIALLGLSARRRVGAGLRRTFQQELVVEELTAVENIQATADHVSPDRASARREVEAALDFVGLDERRNTLGRELNLFQRRMVEIAKTLIGRPRVILMDEPGAGLNEVETEELRRLLIQIPSAFDTQLVLIDHDADLIASVCIETMVLDFGKLLAFGTTRAVLDDPVVRRAYLGRE